VHWEGLSATPFGGIKAQGVVEVNGIEGLKAIWEKIQGKMCFNKPMDPANINTFI